MDGREVEPSLQGRRGRALEAAARAVRSHRRGWPPVQDLLRWDAAAPRRGRLARGSPKGPVPRRADDRSRPGQPGGRVEHDRRAGGGGHDGAAHHAIPGGGGPSRRAAGRDRSRPGHRRRHARQLEKGPGRDGARSRSQRRADRAPRRGGADGREREGPDRLWPDRGGERERRPPRRHRGTEDPRVRGHRPDDAGVARAEPRRRLPGPHGTKDRSRRRRNGRARPGLVGGGPAERRRRDS